MIQTHAEHPSLLNLPTELFDSILNHLSDHKSSLRSCCLASRAFLPTAQALLFRRVVIDAHPERPHLRAGTKLRHLVELSHLLSPTREFHVSGGHTINTETWPGKDTELLPALEAFISLKNSHITADCGHPLQYISLELIKWHMSSPNLLNATFQRLLALESVTRILICWSDMPLNIFQHFPSGVKILELVHITFQNSAPAAQVPDSYPKLANLPAIRLESLIINQLWVPDQLVRTIFNNPSRGCDGTSIRTLDVIWLKAHEFGTYVTFAPHVENLSIWSAQDYTPLDFSQFSRLRCLYIRLDAIGNDPEIRWLAQSLKTGNSLRSITLNIFQVPNQFHNVLAWAELDSVLAGLQFESESFSGITIEMTKRYSRTDFYSLLPRTTDKKLLKIINTS